jgi:autotransporter translocation and assembly factor TamB
VPRSKGFGLRASVKTTSHQVGKVDIAGTAWELSRDNMFSADAPWLATGRVDQVHVASLDIPRSDVVVRLSTNGVRGEVSSELVSSNVQLRVNGRVDHFADATSFWLDSVDGKAGESPLSLPAPLELQRDGADWALSPVTVVWGKFRPQIQATLDQHQEITGHVSLPAVPISDAFPSQRANLTGQVGGTLEIGGTLSNLSARVQAAMTDLGINDPAFEDLPLVSVSVQAGMSNGVLRAVADVSNTKGSQLTAEGTIPAAGSIRPWQFNFDRTSHLQAALRGQLDLNIVNALPIAVDQRLQGLLSVELNAAGSLSKPALSGTSRLRNGTYEHFTLGTEIKDLQFDLVARDQELSLKELKGIGPTRGTLSGSGSIALDAERGFPGAFNLTLDKIRLVQNDLLRAFGSGKLQLVGDAKKATLGGALSITPMQLHVPKHLPPTASRFRVIDPARPPSGTRVPPKDRVGKVTNPLVLDFSVNAPGQFAIDGRGLLSAWSGNLRFTGPSERPQITGVLRPDHGTFDFFGQLFRLKESQIQFTGSVPPAPLLNVVFEREKKEYTAYLRISGSTKAPIIRLESEPALPEEELLPQLLFGKDASELSPLQALKIAKAANALKGGGSTVDVMGRARKWLTVDELEIEQSEDDDALATARVGKALNDRVYIEGESDLGGDSSALRLEVELTPRLSLESDIQSEMKRGIGLKWKRRF